MTVYAYCRVSTKGQNLENQVNLLAKAFQPDHFIKVKVSSKTNFNRRKITDLIDRLTKGDVIVVTEFSRLARSLKELLSICDLIRKKGAGIKSHTEAFLEIKPGNGDVSAFNELMLSIIGAVHQFERSLISSRTKAALARKKAEGVKLGNSKALKQFNADRKAGFAARCETLRPRFEKMVAEGLSQRSMSDRLNKENVTAIGDSKIWYLPKVQKVLKQLGLYTKRARKEK